MTEVEQQILESLLEMERVVEGMAAGKGKVDLLPIFARLDQLAQSLPASADSNLRHYLQRKSYQKARVHLQDLAAR
jgi:hypothetical protein